MSHLARARIAYGVRKRENSLIINQLLLFDMRSRIVCETACLELATSRGVQNYLSDMICVRQKYISPYIEIMKE